MVELSVSWSVGTFTSRFAFWMVASYFFFTLAYRSADLVQEANASRLALADVICQAAPPPIASNAVTASALAMMMVLRFLDLRSSATALS